MWEGAWKGGKKQKRKRLGGKKLAPIEIMSSRRRRLCTGENDNWMLPMGNVRDRDAGCSISSRRLDPTEFRAI